jgi:hypothetical protein
MGDLNEKWKTFLQEHELPLRAIPVAIFSHELIGIGWLGGTWFGCYILQPSRNMAMLVNPERVKTTIEAAKRFTLISTLHLDFVLLTF